MADACIIGYFQDPFHTAGRNNGYFIGLPYAEHSDRFLYVSLEVNSLRLANTNGLWQLYDHLAIKVDPVTYAVDQTVSPPCASARAC